MNVIVRLYWQHDLDLVALTLHPMFEMGKWMKKAMIAYAQGDEEFHIPLPPEMPPEKPLENCDAHFAESLFQTHPEENIAYFAKKV